MLGLLSVSHTEEERNKEREIEGGRERSLALRLRIDAAIMHTVKRPVIAWSFFHLIEFRDSFIVHRMCLK